MKNETIGLEKLEVSELIQELREEKNIHQDILYAGLCKRKKYFQLECGEVIMDELLSECLFSRLHVQYRLLDIMLDDTNFWQKECRHEINLQIKKHSWDKAEVLLAEYEVKAPKDNIHKQYVLGKRAEIGFQTGEQKTGKTFREALELTMSVRELENRLQGSGVISENELWLYLRHRSCENPLSVEEYLLFLEQIEGWFLSAQIYAEVYFEAAYQFAYELWETEQYALCREICEKAVSWLKRGIKNFHSAEFYFLDAASGMRLPHGEEEERGFYQQCKMACYVSAALSDRELAKKMAEYCEEEWKWHITV